jgi:2'-5' RNA ligase
MEARLQSALSLVIRDAEPFDAVRRDFATRPAVQGVPFHVTLLYPFAPRDELSAPLLADVRDFFASQAPLEFALTRIAHWPTVVYAVPEPDEPLVACVRALHARYPQWPPYEGIHETVLPHATLGVDVEGDAVRGEIERRLTAYLPRSCSFREVTLLEEFAPDRWRERQNFPLGG